MADTPALGAGAERRVGSTPAVPTTFQEMQMEAFLHLIQKSIPMGELP